VTLQSGLEVIRGHLNWYHSNFESLGTVSYSQFIATMAVSLAICEVFSVKELRDLENSWVMRIVQGHWKWRRSIEHNTTFYRSAIVTKHPIFQYAFINNINVKNFHGNLTTVERAQNDTPETKIFDTTYWYSPYKRRRFENRWDQTLCILLIKGDNFSEIQDGGRRHLGFSVYVNLASPACW